MDILNFILFFYLLVPSSFSFSSFLFNAGHDPLNWLMAHELVTSHNLKNTDLKSPNLWAFEKWICVANNTPSIATSQFKWENVLPNVNKKDTILDKI